MKKVSLAAMLGVAFLLLSAALAANLDGGRIEMRGAWIAKAF
jgi:hypothetical protein